jgi:hypothetical protein
VEDSLVFTNIRGVAVISGCDRDVMCVIHVWHANLCDRQSEKYVVQLAILMFAGPYDHIRPKPIRVLSVIQGRRSDEIVSAMQRRSLFGWKAKLARFNPILSTCLKERDTDIC